MAREQNKNKSAAVSGAVVATPSATAAIPLAVGAGIATAAIYNTRNKILGDKLARTQISATSPLQEVVRSAASASSSVDPIAVGNQIKSAVSDVLKNTSWNGAVGQDARMSAVLSAYNAAISRHIQSPLEVQALISAAQGLKTGSPEQLATELAGRMGTGGLASMRAGRLFSQNLSGAMKYLKSNSAVIPIQGLNTTTSRLMTRAEFAALPQGFRESLGVFAKGIGGRFSHNIHVIERPGVAGSMLNVTFTGKTLPSPITLQIPRSITGPGGVNTGLVLAGKDLNQLYATGTGAMVKGGQVVSTGATFEEYAMLRARDVLLPQIRGMKDTASVQDAVHRFHARFVKPGRVGVAESEWREREQWLNGIFRTDVSDPAMLMRQRAAYIRYYYNEAGQQLTPAEISQLVKSGVNLGEPISPGRTGGASFIAPNAPTFRPAQFLMSHSRRPHQVSREYIMSAAARARAKEAGVLERYKFMQGSAWNNPWPLSGERLPEHGVPGIAFFSSKPLAGFKEGMHYMTPEQMLMHESIGTSRVKFSALLPEIRDRLTEVRKGYYHGKDLDLIPAGTAIGYTTEGELYVNKYATSIAEAIHTSAGMEVNMLDVVGGENVIHTFGTFKGLGMRISRRKMWKLIGKDVFPPGIPEIGLIGGFEDIRKNRNLHLQQMVSAMDIFNTQNLGRKIQQGEEAVDEARQYFRGNLSILWDNLANMSRTDKGYKLAISKLVRRGKEIGLDPRQAGLIFGSLPHVGIDPGEVGIRTHSARDLAWRTQIARGNAIGAAFQYYEGPAEKIQGSGRALASIEPRLLDWIGEHNFGKAHREVFSDILTRSIWSNPDAASSSLALTRSLSSLRPDSKAPSGSTIHSLASLDDFILNPKSDHNLFQKGGWVDFGGFGGMGHFYVPGQNEIQGLTPFKTPSGEILPTDISKSYTRFLGAAAEMRAAGKAGEFAELHSEFTGLLGKATAATITEKGGMASGKLAGSRFLRATMGPDVSPKQDLNLWRMNPETFSRMAAEQEELLQLMYRHNGAERDALLAELAEMTKQFMAGKRVPMLTWRHPVIGQYSARAVHMVRDMNVAPGDVRVPAIQYSVSSGGTKLGDVSMSNLVGMAGDVDADNVAVMLAHPGYSRQLSSVVRDQVVNSDYEGFAIRHSLLKPRSVKGDVVDLAAEMHKSLVASDIGRLSENLSMVKEGLKGVKAGGSRSDALYLMEWLEQNIISGKHLKDSEAANMPQIIDQIIGAVKNNNMSSLGPMLRSAMKEEAINAFETSQVYDITNMLDGSTRQVTAPGFKIEEALATAGEGISNMGNPSKVGSRAWTWKMMRGNKDLSPEHINDMLSGLDGGMLSGLLPEVEGLKATRTLKEVELAGEELAQFFVRNKTTVGLAAGGALVAAGLLGTVMGGFSPPPQPQLNSEVGDQVRAETIKPDQASMGQPSTPPPPSRPAPVSMHTQRMSASIRVSGKVRGSVDPNGMSHAVRGTLGTGTNINTRITDDRSVLTPEKLGAILDQA